MITTCLNQIIFPIKVVGLLDTSEVLTDNGWQPFHLTLPKTTESHCVVSLNSTTIMFIGGFENEKNSYFFNSDHEEWVKGKPWGLNTLE